MKKLLTLICIVVLCLTACSKKEFSRQIEYGNSKVDGFKRSVLLNESTFKSIYQFEQEVEIEDLILIAYTGNSKTDAVYNKLDLDQSSEVLTLLLGLEIEKSSMSSTVTVNSPGEYELVFNEPINAEVRNYSIEIGKSYLLVFLAGESDNIIKHDLTTKQYKKLKKLLETKIEES